jgi:hypothetical protein
MFRRRLRADGRFAKNQTAAHRDSWAALLLNCPLCGHHLTPRVERKTYVFACADHGKLFVAADDGRLYDAAKDAVRSVERRRSADDR